MGLQSLTRLKQLDSMHLIQVSDVWTENGTWEGEGNRFASREQSTSQVLVFFFFVCFFLSHTMQLVGYINQGQNWGPRHWKHESQPLYCQESLISAVLVFAGGPRPLPHLLLWDDLPSVPIPLPSLLKELLVHISHISRDILLGKRATVDGDMIWWYTGFPGPLGPSGLA